MTQSHIVKSSESRSLKASMISGQTTIILGAQKAYRCKSRSCITSRRQYLLCNRCKQCTVLRQSWSKVDPGLCHKADVNVNRICRLARITKYASHQIGPDSNLCHAKSSLPLIASQSVCHHCDRQSSKTGSPLLHCISELLCYDNSVLSVGTFFIITCPRLFPLTAPKIKV